MRSDIVSGALFPDYELTDHTGKRRKLSELQGQDPMVLVLSRGSFCPKDRRQHEGLVQLHRELEAGYCRLVTISTDNHLQDLHGLLVPRPADGGRSRVSLRS
jgi:peroxiredoxin